MPDWLLVIWASLLETDPLKVAVLSLLVALWGLLIAHRNGRRLRALESRLGRLHREQERFDTEILAVQGALKAVAEEVIAQGQHQAGVRQALDRLAEQHSELRLRADDEGVYMRAIELIRLGHGRNEVRRLCGLTDSEVDLLFSLHRAGLAHNRRSSPSE